VEREKRGGDREREIERVKDIGREEDKWRVFFIDTRSVWHGWNWRLIFLKWFGYGTFLRLDRRLR
jgi:hypothetical protein